MKVLFGFLFLVSFSAFAQSGFKLPADWETQKAQKILEIESSKKSISWRYRQFCSRFAAKNMNTNQYLELLAYQELTGKGCGESIYSL